MTERKSILSFSLFFQHFFYFFTVKNGMRIVLGSQACADTYKVVDAIVNALKSQRPQARYVLGFDAKLYNLISLLPTSIADRLLPKFL